jgi:hypothetical protein
MTDAGNSTKSVPGRPFQPGQSGNPLGRPRGFGSLIREQTKDGAELVDAVFKTLRGKTNLKTRQWAIEWLADRGWGKAVQSTEITGADGGAIVVKGYQTVTPDDWPAN